MRHLAWTSFTTPRSAGRASAFRRERQVKTFPGLETPKKSRGCDSLKQSWGEAVVSSSMLMDVDGRIASGQVQWLTSAGYLRPSGIVMTIMQTQQRLVPEIFLRGWQEVANHGADQQRKSQASRSVRCTWLSSGRSFGHKCV